jgi:hypothetical protein
MDAEILCTLLDVEIQPLRSKQPYGAVTAGRIKVYGEVKQVLWSADRKTVKHNEIQVTVDDWALRIFPDALEHNAQDMTVDVLKVAINSSTILSRGLVKHFEGILLEHIGNEVYQRVGVMRIRNPGWSEWLDASRQLWSEGFVSKEIYIV